MPLLAEHEISDDHKRIVYLEARVAALERALAHLSLRVDVRAEGDPVHTQRLAPLSPAPTGSATTLRLPRTETRESLDRLGITASLASLDERLAQEAASEASLLPRERSQAGVLEIDASLIDRAFARPAPQKIEVRATLEERHPKILERICATWRTPELLAYLKRLIVDDRGDRAGFDPHVMSDLLLLSAILEEPEAQDRWEANARTF